MERVKLSSSGLHNSTPVDSEVESSNVTFNACAEKIKLYLMQTNKVPMQCIPPSMKVF